MEDVQDIYELSPMQHGMLFDSVTVDDSGMYLIQLDYFLEGELSVPQFRSAWQATFDRHPVLRTSFHWEEIEKPLQVVHPRVEVPLAYVDLTELEPEAQEQRVDAAREEDRASGVDFESAPLARLFLFRVGERAYRLLWSFHHILMEGWSASIVLDEALARYRSMTSGAPLALRDHRPYRDLIGWIQEQDPARAEAYWREELRGIRTPTHLGIDRSPTTAHAPVTEYDGRAVTLSTEATETLGDYAKRQGLTLNTLVQGAWSVLLARYSGEEEVVFGTIVSGRSVPLEGVEDMVGLFVNLLPSRVAVSDDEALGPWLEALQVRQAKQREFEYCSLAQVKAWSEMPAGLPLFENLLVFENWSGSLSATEWGADLRVADVHGHHGSPGYPLTLVVAPGPQLTIGISYDRERFHTEAIRDVLAHLEVLLLGMARDPDQRLGDLPLADVAERERSLFEWNRTEDAGLSREPVQRQFEERARTTPDALAVEAGEERWTYRELDQRANRLAQHLRAEGIGERALVGLCTDREPAMISGMLGILKAGCAYVPMDPGYPEERLRFLLEDSGVEAIVTVDRVASLLSGARLIRLDTDAEAIAARSAEPVSCTLGADDLAYVIYTSGSTGRPKGVMIPHGALANYVGHALAEFDMRSDDRTLQFASMSFDTAAEEIYPTLVCGGALVLRTDAMLASVSDFLETCAAWKVTLIDFPTAYWHAVVDGLADAGVPFPDSVRLAILGGERVLPDKLLAWFELVPDGPRLLNTYGPTEATIVGTCCTLSAQDPLAADVAIGRPVRNARAYVLDSRGRPVAVGVPGELCLAGAGLARGYLGRSELTAERFVPDPFAAEGGGDETARMYRTGDLVRHRPDGELEFVGRLDTQVKFRGYRIELGEIEAALARHQAVKEAVVLLREDVPGTQRLVAYVVAADPAPTAEELSRVLSAALPRYMVPAATVFLDALPLTQHGKVDRRALPEPDRSRPQRESGFVAPRTPLEEQIAEIWQAVLDVDRVGVYDNFFDLGGHSLLLMQLTGELKKKLGVRLTPGELVVPTLGQLTALCEERLRDPKSGGGLVRKLVNAIRGLSAASRPGGGAS